jgi:hypothetical protein
MASAVVQLNRHELVRRHPWVRTAGCWVSYSYMGERRFGQHVTGMDRQRVRGVT